MREEKKNDSDEHERKANERKEAIKNRFKASILSKMKSAYVPEPQNSKILQSLTKSLSQKTMENKVDEDEN